MSMSPSESGDVIFATEGWRSSAKETGLGLKRRRRNAVG